MKKLIHIFIKLLRKYYSLRYEAWTHFLILVTYIFVIPSLYIYITLSQWGGGPDLFVIYSYIGIPFFLCFVMLALIMGLYNQFRKHKITNKFLTQNKFYGVYWHIGNILFLYIMGILLTLFISLFRA